MRRRSHDRGFVAAPPERVYGRLADAGSYPSWWPGTEAAEGSLQLHLGRRNHRAVAGRHRADVGLFMTLGGDVELEWFLERWDDGTIVSCLLDVDAGWRRADRRLLRMRGTVRQALVGLKEDLE
jgi:hypothetical protein